MQKFFLSAALAAGVMATASGAQAFPASSTLQRPDGEVIQVRNLCGLGWHRGPYGVCRRNGVPYYGPYAYAPPPPYPGRCWWIETAYGPRRMCSW
jgi:hypothetical protein